MEKISDNFLNGAIETLALHCDKLVNEILQTISKEQIRTLINVVRLLDSIESHHMKKPTKSPVCPAKTQISLGIWPVWSESWLCAQWVAKDPSFLQADSEDSDQTGQMPRLIWVFAGRTAILLVFSCTGSYYSCRIEIFLMIYWPDMLCSTPPWQLICTLGV